MSESDGPLFFPTSDRWEKPARECLPLGQPAYSRVYNENSPGPVARGFI